MRRSATRSTRVRAERVEILGRVSCGSHIEAARAPHRAPTHTYTRARHHTQKLRPNISRNARSRRRPLALALLLLPTVAAETRPRNAHLGKLVRHPPPVSRVASKLGNSSSIPAGGAVWPTAIFWAMVQVGTPPQDFPAAFDSGSGDLDIGAVGCSGCVTTPPNRGYDHSLSSTSKLTFPFTFKNTYETCDLKHPTAPCSISGKVYSDQVSMAGFGPVAVKVGAIEKQDLNFDQFKAIDGVVASRRVVRTSSRRSSRPGRSRTWAICMRAGSHSNGTMLGGVDPNRPPAPSATWTTHRVVSTVNVASILRNGRRTRQRVDQGRKRAILDTGTNILLLLDQLLVTFHETMCKDALPRAKRVSNQCVSRPLRWTPTLRSRSSSTGPHST